MTQPARPRRKPAVRRTSHPVARTGYPRSITAVGSVAGAGAVYALADGLGNGTLMQALVFVVVGGLTIFLPSLRLTDPRTRLPLTRDSSLSSILYALAAGLVSAYAAGSLPLPDEARGLITALIALIGPGLFPSVLGTAEPTGLTVQNRL